MNRKSETKRLLLYLAFSFGLTWCIFFAFILTGHKWDGSNPRLETFAALGMLMPALSHILTRQCTKEGFAVTGKDSMMLGISFGSRKWFYFVFAMVVPWLYFEIWHALALLVSPEMFDPNYYQVIGIDKNLIWLMPLNGIVTGTVISFAAFGEEFGWRGYMMPKLIKLLGIKKAVFAGGIIWGLWHAPLTCVGHNFGTDYPGFPYLGILVMCLDCTVTGIMLTYLTVKSGSIWPAAIMHAVNNANPSILALFTNTDKAAGILNHSINGYFLYFIPTAIIAGFCLVQLCRDKECM